MRRGSIKRYIHAKKKRFTDISEGGGVGGLVKGWERIFLWAMRRNSPLHYRNIGREEKQLLIKSGNEGGKTSLGGEVGGEKCFWLFCSREEKGRVWEGGNANAQIGT